MCFEGKDSTLGRIKVVDIGEYELIHGNPIDFDHLFVGINSFIIYDLEVDVAAAAFQPVHYGVVHRDTVFVAAHFVGCL